ncbi:histidine kinase [[Empedobacter] haloabium]|uniref:Histidine kinase n=1 Tax=[Empedobacter] haloabium TaxID=592317 RepID=A0ABZ1UG60_9BURK
MSPRFEPARLAALPFHVPLLAGVPISLCIAILGLPDIGHGHSLSYRTLFFCTFLAWLAPTAALQRLLWRRGWAAWAMTPAMLAATYLMSALNNVLGQTLSIHLGRYDHYKWHDILAGMDGCWLPLIAFCATHAVVAYHAALTAERARAAEALVAQREAELRALRYQLQPHFLFNTLNAVSALVTTGRDRDANRMIVQLADLLRATLATGQAHEHALADELALTESYLEIEKARLGERLRIALDVGPGILDAQVPCLLLQPLVENAVRHGIAPAAQGGALALKIAARGDVLHIALTNDVLAADAATDSHRVGLRNVAERLARLYGERHRFLARHEAGRSYTVDIELPLRRDAATATATAWIRAA